eukprot:scaffold878_cov271-Pinguiococcus_pyrenoidosus.AAC.22
MEVALVWDVCTGGVGTRRSPLPKTSGDASQMRTAQSAPPAASAAPSHEKARAYVAMPAAFAAAVARPP